MFIFVPELVFTKDIAVLLSVWGLSLFSVLCIYWLGLSIIQGLAKILGLFLFRSNPLNTNRMFYLLSIAT